MFWLVIQKPDGRFGASQPHALRALAGCPTPGRYGDGLFEMRSPVRPDRELARIVAEFHGRELRRLVLDGRLNDAWLVDATSRGAAIRSVRLGLALSCKGG